MDGSAAEASILEQPSFRENPQNSKPDDDASAPTAAPAPAPAPLTPEELVAKARAPVKKEFLRPPPIRTSNSTTSQPHDAATEPNSTPLIKEKKSKRQLKRERRQELKSALHLCPEVAKSGDVGSCCYGEKCRFSHDVEAFNAQKPADLKGSCPFLKIDQGLCHYGLACRFSGTHRANGVVAAGTLRNEVNSLNKDVQKLLWKNKMRFPKADATLKLLGLSGKIKKLVDTEDNQVATNGSAEENAKKDSAEIGSVSDVNCCSELLEEDKPEDADATEDIRPVKKAKSSCDESYGSTEVNAGYGVHGKEDISSKPNGSKSVDIADTVTVESDKILKLHPREKKLIDFREKLYLAPLTTVGNLPFRRVCKLLGADVTCGEMAMCTNLLQGQASEWALLRRHSSEDLFGVQICGAYPDTVSRTVELIEQECSVDFIDLNMGCPIDIVVNKGAGSALLTKPMRMKSVIQAASGTVDTPITIKVRTGYFEGRNRIDSVIEDIGNWGASAVTIHGRSRQQRYSKLADWEYIYQCAQKAPDSLQVLGNGDVFSYLDWNKHKFDCPQLSACMVARGALIKPWIFTEIKEQRHWDISSAERLDIFKDYVHFGLQHWGSDSKGVETTRHFLLEWLSYSCRYIPVGLLDVIPQKINWRPPSYYGRDDLETLMASDSAADWIRISEMLLGKVPAGFTFSPKHKSNAYDSAENG
ncbi:tRNA-dihydrouridine(47) synthase [NAD(P)(+)]-like [Coffea eugenioides]|uniref:tRNA-dihydrouridine(47) synthase [NAD(P)(+)]-like n=1 Tax=Coffea eugenioides TaxID=49369 RepID=UPI000F60D214|nr:tRNA-dihydrouridine(47) synthase [NAD(P)(+)]-like [Coffea eugenioides]